jgi:hypothetical protein
MSPRSSPYQQYLEWVQDQIEDFKSGLTRNELLSLADDAVNDLFHGDDPQVPLTEILLREAVDALIFQRLGLPGYRRWLKVCQSDTPSRPSEGTHADSADQRNVS